MMKKLKCRRKQSEAFLDVLFQFAVAMSLIFCFVALWKPFIYKQNMDYMAKTLVRAVEANGRIDGNITALANELKSEMGVNPTITWNAAYISGTNKIQLRQKFKLVDMKIPDNYGAATFADDGEIAEYAKESISALQCAGIVNGVENNFFNPNGIVTRAMAAKVIYGLLTAQPNKENAVGTDRSAGTVNVNKSAERLKAFGLITDADAMSETGENITGAEFAKWIMNAVGLGDVYGGDKAVVGARDRGYISDGDEFAADSALKYNTAVKLVMEALGYRVMAQQQGGYPNGYIAAAGTAKVLKNVTPEQDGTISRSNAIRLLDNALETDLMENVISGNSVDRVEIKNGENIVNTYLKIDKYRGKIESVNRSTKNVTFKADNTTHTLNVADNINIYSVIADDADIYVKDDEIVYIYYRGTIHVMYDFIEEVNGDSDSSKEYMTSGIKNIYLTNDGKSYDADRKLTAYYKDKSIEWASAPLAGSFAQITVKDSKIIEIQAYPLYEGGAIYHASIDMIKYRKGYDSNNVINGITDVDDMLIYIDGIPTDSVEKLAPDMVFDYYLSDDEDKMIIVASSRTFTADLEGYGTNTVTAGGKKYYVSGYYGCYAYNNTAQKYETCDNQSSIIKEYLGKKATFLIDDRKQLRYIHASATTLGENSFLGVVMKAVCDNMQYMTPSDVQFSIYNISDGTGEKTYEVADSIKSSPVSLEYAMKMAKNLDGKGFFKFTLNSDGKISRIEVPQYWGDEFTYRGGTDNKTPSVIGKLYIKNSKLFAVYSDDGEFKVKELEWAADLQNVSFDENVQIISDYNIYNNPIPGYVMFANGVGSLNHKRSTQLLTEIEYIEDDKAIMTLNNQWGSTKYTVSKATAERYHAPALIEATTGHLSGDQIRITKYIDLSVPPDEWATDAFEEFKVGFYRADRILYGDDQVAQFQVNGNPTNVYKLSDYFYVLQYENGKEASLTRLKGNVPLGYISPNDNVWFYNCGDGDYGVVVDLVVYEKNGMAPKE